MLGIRMAAKFSTIRLERHDHDCSFALSSTSFKSASMFCSGSLIKGSASCFCKSSRTRVPALGDSAGIFNLGTWCLQLELASVGSFRLSCIILCKYSSDIPLSVSLRQGRILELQEYLDVSWSFLD